MTNNCDMARDLMPLTIDGVASEASQQFVTEHLEECAECRAYLAGMKASLKVDVDQAAREKRDFTRTAAHMRLRRWLRRAMIVALALVVAIVGLYAGIYAHNAYNSEKIMLTSNAYTVLLSQLKDGRVIVTAQTFNKRISELVVQDVPTEDGGRYGNIELWSTRSSNVPRGDLRAYELPSAQGYEYIVYDWTKRIWTRGETIAPASSEMEAYYAARDALEAFNREVEKRHIIEQAEKGDFSETYQLTPEEKGERYDLETALNVAKTKVPEWNNGTVIELETAEPRG